MTQTGKCDICRQRKVKCDEEKPKCGSCRKKDRPCTYTYGKASAFVVQDPQQLTKHGKSKTAPIVYSLSSSPSDESSPSSTPSDLQLTTERFASSGGGIFATLAPISKKDKPSKRAAAYQKKKFEAHLQELRNHAALSLIQPCSPEDVLKARYLHMLGSEKDLGTQPMSILGTWIQSIPSRIGTNRMLDLAVEFFINSHDVYRDETYSKRRLARASKAKALRELQLQVLESAAQTAPSYETILATKTHYAAEALLGINSMYHAIHAFGLAELLKTGTVSNVDDEHYWNLIDNTYIDDVHEALMAGRPSCYDNEFYLSSTYPPPLDSPTISLSDQQRASIAIMHVFIQSPRLVVLLRKAVSNPSDTQMLAAAVSQAESMWLIDLPRHVAEFLQNSFSVIETPHDPAMADLMPYTFTFTSIQRAILCTRYWMLMITLCGLLDTLHVNFPNETALSLLPDPVSLRAVEVDAALQLGMSLAWANSVSHDLPLVPLRLHTPLQVSIGPWHRITRDHQATQQGNSPIEIDEMPFDFARAYRMKAWVTEQCNKIHRRWAVSEVEDEPLLQAIDCMAGNPIPDWLPIRVRFEAEDGEMVMKLDYESKNGVYSEQYDLSANAPQKRINPYSPEDRWVREAHVHELPIRSGPDNPGSIPSTPSSHLETMDNVSSMSVDYLLRTGRNLCSTAGWWPDSPSTSTVLLDSTHKASAFSNLPRPQPHVSTASHIYYDEDRHPCLASSFWPQTPNTLDSSLSGESPTTAWVEAASATSSSTPDSQCQKKNPCLSPAWASNRSARTAGSAKNASLSPPWSGTPNSSSTGE